VDQPAIDVEQSDELRQQHIGRLSLRAHRAFSVRAIKKLRIRGTKGSAWRTQPCSLTSIYMARGSPHFYNVRTVYFGRATPPAPLFHANGTVSENLA
jgi:hypothetical protein